MRCATTRLQSGLTFLLSCLVFQSFYDVYKYVQKDFYMTEWNRLLAQLDLVFGFPNMVSSKAKKLQQGFDQTTQEHIIWIEYRVRVSNSKPPSVSENIHKQDASLLSALIS